MFSLNGKTALVTGGGSGIGNAIASLFAEHGAEVAVVDLNAGAAEKTTKEIQSKKGIARAYACNVADQNQVNEIVRKEMAVGGRLDIIVNSAGIAHIGKLENTTPDDLNRVYDVNVKGVFHVMHAAIGPMKAQGGGCILNIASVAASVGVPDRFAYSMSKGAVVSMSLSVAKDYLNDHIRCNCISPARIHTPFVDTFLEKNYPGREREMFEKLSKTQPVGRMGTPEEVASLALYLCSDEASFVTGCDYPLDGGFMKLNT